MSYAEKIKDSLYWWLGKKKPFIINDEYRLELLHIDKVNNSVKILITNLKDPTKTSEVALPSIGDINEQR